jgi:hypothetical protein
VSGKWTENVLRPTARGILNHTRAWFIGAWILTALSGLSIYLNFDISSDFKDLMPENARSMTDFVKISERFGSVTPLKVMIEVPPFPRSTSSPPAPPSSDGTISQGRPLKDILDDAQHQTLLVTAATATAQALWKLDAVGYVHYHNDKQFFKDNILLYASVEDLDKLYDDVDKALNDARKEIGSLIVCEQIGGCDDDEPPPDPNAQKEDDLLTSGFDPDAQLSKGGSEINFYQDYFLDELADGGWLITIHVRFRDAATTLKASEKHLKDVNDAISSLRLTDRVHPSIAVNRGGGLQDQSDEYNTLLSEIKLGGAVTIGLLLLMMAAFFRRLRATITVMLPLIMSIVWTLGLAFWLVGTLNLITAFLFAILLGLGIDFGIHLLARYDEERRRGVDPQEAMLDALVEVGGSNVVGGITTAAAFFTLTAGEFRGFSQFGLVAGLGVLISLTAMLTVLPAVELLMERAWPIKLPPLQPDSPTRVRHHSSSPWLRRALIAMVFIAAAASIASITQATEVQFEENFYRLKMRPSTKATQQVNRYGVADKRHSSPAIALLDSLEEVSALEKIVRRRQDPQTIEQIRQMRSYFPHTFDRLVSMVPYAFLSVDDYIAAPVIGAIGRLLPDNLWSNIPYYLRYDRPATLTERDLRAFTRLYPALTDILAFDLLRLPLAYHDVYSRLAPLASMHRLLPPNLYGDIPTRAHSRALHSVDYFASIYSFMPGTPSEQAARLEAIDRLRMRTSPRRVRFLPPDKRKRVEEFYPYLIERPVTVTDLPPWVKIQFKEAGDHPAPPRPGQAEDYTYGNVGVIYQNTSSIKGSAARRFTGEMRSIIIDNKSVVVSNNAFIFADMITQVKADGVLVALLGLVAIFLFVLAQHRSLSQALIVLSPLITALSWTIGLMVVFNIRLGFFNMVTVPLIMGMGVDDGIHFYHRYREEGRGSLLHVMQKTGGAIFMTSATTIVGFGSMIFSSHMGLNTLGQLVVLGMGSCWLATMTVQPGLLLLAERFKVKALIPDHDYDPTRDIGAPPAPTPTPAST